MGGLANYIGFFCLLMSNCECLEVTMCCLEFKFAAIVVAFWIELLAIVRLYNIRFDIPGVAYVQVVLTFVKVLT